MPHRYFFQFLIRYKYQVIFPVAVVEGPIITIISGILVSLGYLNFLPTFLLIFAADMVSDPGLYLIGRFGRNILQRLPFIKLPEARVKKLEEHYRNHPGKTILATKLSYGVSSLFLIVAGLSKMSWKTFLGYIASIDAVKSTLLLLVGYYFGRAALRFTRGYLPYYAAALVVIIPLAYYFFIKRREKKKLQDIP